MIFKALETHQSTLQALTIKGAFSEDSTWIPIANPYLRKSFKALKSLNLEERSIFGRYTETSLEQTDLARGFPPSLVSLSISDCLLKVLKPVKQLVTQAHEYSPNLENISITGVKWAQVGEPLLVHCEELKVIEGLCKAACIKFEMILPKNVYVRDSVGRWQIQNRR